jgi:hypothetical protein
MPGSATVGRGDRAAMGNDAPKTGEAARRRPDLLLPRRHLVDVRRSLQVSPPPAPAPPVPIRVSPSCACVWLRKTNQSRSILLKTDAPNCPIPFRVSAATDRQDPPVSRIFFSLPPAPDVLLGRPALSHSAQPAFGPPNFFRENLLAIV